VLFVRVYQRDHAVLSAPRFVSTIVNATGDVVDEHREVLAPERFRGGTAADCIVDIPVSRLGRGLYLLTVEAIGAGAEVRRQVRFTVE
jgi:hypothetical protein